MYVWDLIHDLQLVQGNLMYGATFQHRKVDLKSDRDEIWGYIP